MSGQACVSIGGGGGGGVVVSGKVPWNQGLVLAQGGSWAWGGLGMPPLMCVQNHMVLFSGLEGHVLFMFVYFFLLGLTCASQMLSQTDQIMLTV